MVGVEKGGLRSDATSSANLPSTDVKMSPKAQVGDVIKSERFNFGVRDIDGKISVGYCDDHVDEYTGELTGKLIGFGDHVDYSRGRAEYVVERAAMEGGKAGLGPFGALPDGWHVTARRLAENGTYNPEGETISFYQSGVFRDMVREVEVVRQLEQYSS